MENSVVETLTASSLEPQAALSLKIQIAREQEQQKALELFLEDYDNAKKVIPANEQSFRKGVVLYALGKYDEASEALDSAESPLSLLIKVLNLLGLERRIEARKQLNELQGKLAQAEPTVLLYSALAACDLKEIDMAKSIAEKIDFSSAGPGGQFLTAYIDELEGRYQEALDGYASAGEDASDIQAYALFHLARLQDLRGNDNLALETYKRIEEIGVAFEEAMVNMGVILEDKGEFSRALFYYERALKINPRNSRAILYHGDAEACLNMHYDERKRKQDIKTTEILNIPISDFELSVRSRNCLSKMGIFTLKDLITKTEQELLSYKNFGETSLKEIRAMLAKKGLHLGMTRVEEQPLAERIKMNAQLYSQEKEYELDELDTLIEDLDLSYRTKSALHKMGFESLRDITMRTGTDLESNPRFSAACLQEVNALLEEKGLAYRPATSTGRPDGDAGDLLLTGEPAEGIPGPDGEKMVAEPVVTEEYDDDD